MIADQTPAQVVRRQYVASARGDLEALRSTLAPDVEWTEMAGFPLAGTYRTPEGVTTNVMEKLASEWEDWTAHDDTYVVDGEDVVVLARYTARHQATRKRLDVRVAHHFGSATASSSGSSGSSTLRWSATQPADSQCRIPSPPPQTSVRPVGRRRFHTRCHQRLPTSGRVSR
jgi:ketosteroid isomerase-like protein